MRLMTLEMASFCCLLLETKNYYLLTPQPDMSDTFDIDLLDDSDEPVFRSSPSKPEDTVATTPLRIAKKVERKKAVPNRNPTNIRTPTTRHRSKRILQLKEGDICIEFGAITEKNKTDPLDDKLLSFINLPSKALLVPARKKQKSK